MLLQGHDAGIAFDPLDADVDGVQHEPNGRGDLGSDAVARDENDLVSHAGTIPRRLERRATIPCPCHNAGLGWGPPPPKEEGDRMEFVQTAISAAVVAAVGIVLGRLANQRFEALESGLAQFRGEVREEMARLESRLVDRIDGVESRLVDRIDGVESRLVVGIDGVESRLDDRIDALDAKLDSKIDSLRADLTQIALAVGAAPRRETG